MLPEEIFLGIHMYGVMIAIGILFCFFILFKYAEKFNVEKKFVDFVFYNGIASIVFGFLSAALFQGLYDYLENPQAGFHLDGSITFMGGLVGGTICFLVIYYLFRKKYKSNLLDILPIIPCCIAIAHAFGRVGCFFAGCCYGRETDSILGVKFPYHEHKVLPTNLYEAIFLFILFGVLSFLVLKQKRKNILSLYLIIYGVFRFLIEFLRGDDRGAFIAFLSPSQFWSIVFIVAGMVLFFIFKRLYEKKMIDKGYYEKIETTI